MWRVTKNMYNITKSAVLLEGEISTPFNIGQGVAQGCNILPILFFIFINQWLRRLGLALLLRRMLMLFLRRMLRLGV